MVLFLHIPRAAGRFVREVIRAGSGTAEMLVLHAPIEIAYQADRQLAEHPFISAQLGYKLAARLDRRARVITFLRDPIARVVSHYRYLVKLAASPASQAGGFAAALGGRSLEDLLCDHDSPISEQFFCNLQTYAMHSDYWLPTRRTLQNRPAEQVLEEAKANLDRIEMVGLVEHMHLSLRRMLDHFGWSAPERMADASPPQTSLEDLPPSLLRLIRERNGLDLALYEHAKQRLLGRGTPQPNSDVPA